MYWFIRCAVKLVWPIEWYWCLESVVVFLDPARHRNSFVMGLYGPIEKSHLGYNPAHGEGKYLSEVGLTWALIKYPLRHSVRWSWNSHTSNRSMKCLKLAVPQTVWSWMKNCVSWLSLSNVCSKFIVPCLMSEENCPRMAWQLALVYFFLCLSS